MTSNLSAVKMTSTLSNVKMTSTLLQRRPLPCLPSPRLEPDTRTAGLPGPAVAGGDGGQGQHEDGVQALHGGPVQPPTTHSVTGGWPALHV